MYNVKIVHVYGFFLYYTTKHKDGKQISRQQFKEYKWHQYYTIFTVIFPFKCLRVIYEKRAGVVVAV